MSDVGDMLPARKPVTLKDLLKLTELLDRPGPLLSVQCLPLEGYNLNPCSVKCAAYFESEHDCRQFNTETGTSSWMPFGRLEPLLRGESLLRHFMCGCGPGAGMEHQFGVT